MSQIFKFSKYDVIFLRNVRNGHFGVETEINTTTLVAIAITTGIEIGKQQQIAEVAETVPICNYCVATIVARPLRTTVKGGRQPSGRRIRVLFLRIQEFRGVSGLEHIYHFIQTFSFPIMS